MTVAAIGQGTGHRRQKQRGDLAGEEDDAELKGGLRHLVDEPGHGDPLHPGADERGSLPSEVQSIIAMRQRAQQRVEIHGPSSAYVDADCVITPIGDGTSHLLFA